MGSAAFIFPGQGSQKVGMGKDLADAFPAARSVFEEVNDALGEDLSKIMWNGPDEALCLTVNAQPALMAVSVAVARVLEEADIAANRYARFMAGHSLGEYSALTVSGSLTLADSARLLRLRGSAMQAAVPVGEGAMAAVLGLDLEVVKDVLEQAAEYGTCQVANDNAPGQVVISGTVKAVEKAVMLAKQAGGKRVVMLPVSAPFHCSLMDPAAAIMSDALSDTVIRPPRVPVVCNARAEAIDSPDRIKSCLVEQVRGMVRWRESVTFMLHGGVDSFYELGSGRVLTGLMKWNARESAAFSVSDPATIETAVASLSGT